MEGGCLSTHPALPQSHPRTPRFQKQYQFKWKLKRFKLCLQSKSKPSHAAGRAGADPIVQLNSAGGPIGALAGPFSTVGVALPEYQFHKYGVDRHGICDLLNISPQSSTVARRWLFIVKSLLSRLLLVFLQWR